MRAYLILPPLRIHMCRLDVRDDVEGGQDTGFIDLAEAAGDEVDLLVESGEGRQLVRHLLRNPIDGGRRGRSGLTATREH